MANLNQLFDVVRGFDPNGNGPSIAESFAPKTGTTVVPGNIVTQQTDGTMDLASTPNRSNTAPLPVWMAVMANDFDNTFVGKFVAVRSNIIVKTDKFAAGAYDEGKHVSFNVGLLKLAAVNDQIIGEVIEDARATDGTLVVYYHGGQVGML